MDALHAAIALGPLATYFIVLGAMNLASRPRLTSGARDAAALAIALSGLIAAGPMELFLVEEAAVSYGAWVWAIMLLAYALFALLIILLMRPRLVVYNTTLDQLRPLVADAASRIDSESRWAGESLVMPTAGVQLHLDPSVVTKNVQLVSSGPEQNVHSWRQLEHELAIALRRTRATPNPYGLSLVLFGVLTAAAITFFVAREPAAVVQALNEMLRR